MAAPPTDSWTRARQAFADQFEKYGNGFVYRRFQKGEAIPVSAEERSRFIDEFNRNIRRVNWTLYVGLALALGAIIAFSTLKGTNVSEPSIFAGIGLALVPYFIFYRWAWGAPSRELTPRTPIARERDPDEVKRIRFQRVTYAQLAGAAFAGLALPFAASSRQDPFSGWNRLWLALGGAIVLLAAAQAFRKWRFEQDNSYAYEATAPISGETQPPDDTGRQGTSQLLRYIPLAVIVLGGAFIALTPLGKQFARAPSFFPIIMLGCGGWALFTVWRGFTKGRIRPFERYIYTTFDRATQPKRFWASMAWNGFFGCLCLWLAFEMPGWTAGQRVQDRCYNEHNEFSAVDSSKACTDLIEGRARLTYLTKADAYVYRAIADESLGDRDHAFADYTQAINLNPKDYYAYLDRGLVSLNAMHLDPAVADFSRANEIRPKSPWPLADRGMAYAWKNDRAHAEADFAAVRAVDPANLVVHHGQGVLDMNDGNLEAAVAEFTAALRQDPHDLWSLQTRADAYQQMGEFQKARADRKMLMQPMKTGNQTSKTQ